MNALSELFPGDHTLRQKLQTLFTVFFVQAIFIGMPLGTCVSLDTAFLCDYAAVNVLAFAVLIVASFVIAALVVVDERHNPTPFTRGLRSFWSWYERMDETGACTFQDFLGCIALLGFLIVFVKSLCPFLGDCFGDGFEAAAVILFILGWLVFDPDPFGIRKATQSKTEIRSE